MALDIGVAINGAILLGNNFCADGHDGNRKGFAISHMHEDHASMVPECLHSGSVYMTAPTRQLLEVLKDDKYRTIEEAKKINCIGRKNIKILDYGQKGEEVFKDGKSESITFHYSNHTLGASQIEINTHDGKVIVYSGDITKDDEPPENIDVLIADATHGHPKYDKYVDGDKNCELILHTLEDKLLGEEPKSVVIHAHRGKLQEAMALISSHKILDQFDFIAPEMDRKIADVYRSFGEFKSIRKNIKDVEDAEDLIATNAKPFIEFSANACGEKLYEKSRKAFTIRMIDNNSCESGQTKNPNVLNIVTDSHATHAELVDYVKRADPGHVIIDATRSAQAIPLFSTLKDAGFSVEIQPRHLAK